MAWLAFTSRAARRQEIIKGDIPNGSSLRKCLRHYHQRPPYLPFLYEGWGSYTGHRTGRAGSFRVARIARYSWKCRGAVARGGAWSSPIVSRRTLATTINESTFLFITTVMFWKAQFVAAVSPSFPTPSGIWLCAASPLAFPSLSSLSSSQYLICLSVSKHPGQQRVPRKLSSLRITFVCKV